VSAEANAALVRRLYEAFEKGDGPGVAALLAEDAAWHVPGRSPVSGTFAPRGSVLSFFGLLRERSGGTFRARLRDVYASDEGAVALAQVGGQRAGRVYDSTYLLRFRVEGGLVREAWLHNWDQAAFEAFWA
jgi:ketosteroid isomerase-like protein